MPRIAPVVPAETDILCERCGYTLNGLPESGNCPECGERIAASTVDAGRRLSAWDQPIASPLLAFLDTSAAVLLRPSRFFRSLATRGDVSRARDFAQLHWILASTMFGIAAATHALWFWTFGMSLNWSLWLMIALPMVLILQIGRAHV